MKTSKNNEDLFYLSQVISSENKKYLIKKY